jgi:hypothetical protein
VLVVDDSPLMREVVRGLVDGFDGFRVVGTARDGEEAARLVHELEPAIVTLDIEMPGVDGLAALGLGSYNWLGDPQLALVSVIAIHTWQWTPFAFLVLLHLAAAVGRHGAQELHDVGGGRDAVVRLLGLVPRAVEADDQEARVVAAHRYGPSPKRSSGSLLPRASR